MSRAETAAIAAWLAKREDGHKQTEVQRSNAQRAQIARRKRAYERFARWVDAHRKTYNRIKRIQMRRWRRSKKTIAAKR